MKRALLLAVALGVIASMASAETVSNVVNGAPTKPVLLMGGTDAGTVEPLTVTSGGGLQCVAPSNSRWDGTYLRKGAIVTDAGVAVLAVTPGTEVSVQCDVATYVSAFTDAGTACSATTCRKLAANSERYIALAPGYVSVAVLAVSGTATCQVYEAQ